MQKIQIHIPNVSNKEIMEKGDTKINPDTQWACGEAVRCVWFKIKVPELRHMFENKPYQ